MAVYTIVADLNGGDAVTADNDLIFKIYDGSDDSLIDTTGSHTTDSDVTVSGDSVTITNVTSSATSFKISAVDEAANESVLSDAFSVLSFTLTNMTENSGVEYQVDDTFSYPTAWGVSDSAFSGDFEYQVEIEETDSRGTMIGLSTLGTGRAYNDGVNPWDYGAQINSVGLIRDIINGVLTDSATTVTNTVGDKLRLVRLSNNLKLYYNSSVIKDFGTITSSDLYVLMSQSSQNDPYIRSPRIL